jgi:hypothetical protein
MNTSKQQTEYNINEKHEGFDKVAKETGSAKLAAWIGQQKYGKKKMEKAAHANDGEGRPLKDSEKLKEDTIDGTTWSWKDELERVHREIDPKKSSLSARAEKAIALRKPKKHTGYVANTPHVSGRKHVGTYGTRYKADDEEEHNVSKPERTFDADALSSALNVTTNMNPHITTTKIKTGMSRAQQRNLHLQKYARTVGKKLSELSPAERRAAMTTFQAESIVYQASKDDIEYQIVKEGLVYRFEILDEDNNVIAEGIAPTENGATVRATRLIESICDKVKKQNKQKINAIQREKNNLELSESKLSELHANIHALFDKPNIYGVKINGSSTQTHYNHNGIRKYIVHNVSYHKKDQPYKQGYTTYVHHEVGSTNVKRGLPKRLGGDRIVSTKNE